MVVGGKGGRTSKCAGVGTYRHEGAGGVEEEPTKDDAGAPLPVARKTAAAAVGHQLSPVKGLRQPRTRRCP